MDPILSPDEIKALMASISVIPKGTEFRSDQWNVPIGQMTDSEPSIESGAIISDQDGQIVWVSEDFLLMTGKRRETLIGQIPDFMKPPANSQKSKMVLWKTLLKGKIFTTIIRDHKASGAASDFELTIIPILGDSGSITSFVHVWKDMDRKIEKGKALWKQAHIDPLTGLPNRNFLSQWMPAEILRTQKEKSRLAVLFLDLNGFKKVNDTCGHTGGDTLLKVISGRLLRCSRATDLVVRLGGDEFLILLNNIGNDTALTTLIERIMESIRKPVRIEGKLVEITGSAGVAICPRDGVDWEELIQKSDEAMYLNKKQDQKAWQLVSSTSIVNSLKISKDRPSKELPLHLPRFQEDNSKARV
jgi:diguanylate cyclase (GGDEF)-like protein/PAS domain S-box-containing protein